ncbi:MAG TPA: helix-turn-helix domain-containing protein [Terriglobales bacterium]|jgi:AcrR family transcriptional regulator|nr:helix-turn-helix domain-containing protein [Terriglobales bacterium]
MPPIPDLQLEERILTAACRLWRKHGERGLTLRGVARAAGTTTPTVYKRFRNKEAIRLALALRFRDDMLAAAFASISMDEMPVRFLAYAEANPHEYDLLRLSWPQLFAPGRPRPGRVLALAQMAARFGGAPEDYEQVADALFLICHGTATMLTIGGDLAAHKTMREVCIKTCDEIVRHIEFFRRHP